MKTSGSIRIIQALEDAIWAADCLSEQQAMPDDGYKPRLESARAVLDSVSPQKTVVSSVFSWNEISRKTRLRWFLKWGDEIDWLRGWRSKEAADRWIESLGERLDWRVGFLFRLKGSSADMEVVDKHKNRANR